MKTHCLFSQMHGLRRPLPFVISNSPRVVDSSLGASRLLRGALVSSLQSRFESRADVTQPLLPTPSLPRWLGEMSRNETQHDPAERCPLAGLCALYSVGQSSAPTKLSMVFSDRSLRGSLLRREGLVASPFPFSRAPPAESSGHLRSPFLCFLPDAWRHCAICSFFL